MNDMPPSPALAKAGAGPAESRGLDARTPPLPQKAPGFPARRRGQAGSPLSRKQAGRRKGGTRRPMTKHDISGGAMTKHDTS